MATLRETKDRIVSIRNTSKITQAMRMVAAAKLRRAQAAVTAARPYANQLQKILRNLASAETDFVHPYFEGRETVESMILVVVTSDRGLCGAFNATLIRAARERIKTLKKEHPGIKINVVPVGRRGVSAVNNLELDVLKAYPDVFIKLDFSTATDLADLSSESFLSGRADSVEFIYSEFVSVMKQEVRTMQVLPIEAAESEDDSGDYAIDYLFEPTRADILDDLLPQYLNIQIWKALLDSSAAEQAARMVAMENATINARDLIDSLELIYNRERQATITKEMLEIVGGAEALSAN